MTSAYPAAQLTDSQKVQNVVAYRTLNVTGREQIVVTWDLNVPDVDDVSEFRVYRSIGTEYTLLSSGIGTNFYADTDAPIYDGVEYNYIVTFVDGSTDEESLKDDATKVNLYTIPSDGIAGRLYYAILESIRRFAWGVNQFGENVVILVKKRIGSHCTLCYSEVDDRATDPVCPECIGTGFTGGYEQYATRLFNYPANMQVISSDIGASIKHIPKTAISSYPIVASGDVIVKQNNRRYVLGGVTPYMMQNFLIQQEITEMAVLQDGHGAWLVPVG
jgi:hypothetical protein